VAQVRGRHHRRWRRILGGLLAACRTRLESAAKLGNACGGGAANRSALPHQPSARGAPSSTPRSAAARRVAAADHDPIAARAEHFEVVPGELAAVAARTDLRALTAAAELILVAETAGARVHVTGVGKPEHVARYAAALLSSTGTPAAFLHGTEVTHGSVGQIRPGDVVIAISNSGATQELLRAVAALRNFGARVIAVTGNVDSELARAAEVVLEARVADEGDVLGFAPRASILAETLVLAALSVQLQEAKGFTREDYARRHPAGELGKRSARST
jgi:arabinose-5-phosphate isomerase